MAKPKHRDAVEETLVFAAYNTHTVHCGPPPRLRNTDEPRLYHGYFENSHGEQFVLTLDRKTGAGTIWGGDIEWSRPKSFTRELLDAALHNTQEIAALIEKAGPDQAARLPIIDAAQALGRLTGLT